MHRSPFGHVNHAPSHERTLQHRQPLGSSTTSASSVGAGAASASSAELPCNRSWGELYYRYEVSFVQERNHGSFALPSCPHKHRTHIINAHISKFVLDHLFWFCFVLQKKEARGRTGEKSCRVRVAWRKKDEARWQ